MPLPTEIPYVPETLPLIYIALLSDTTSLVTYTPTLVDLILCADIPLPPTAILPTYIPLD